MWIKYKKVFTFDNACAIMLVLSKKKGNHTMEYEETKDKKTKDTLRNVSMSAVKGIETKYILLALMKRHKFGLVSTYAIVLTVILFLPFLPGEIIDLFRTIF